MSHEFRLRVDLRVPDITADMEDTHRFEAYLGRISAWHLPMVEGLR